MAQETRIDRALTGVTLAALFLALAQFGCTNTLFHRKERTSIITPAMRIAAIKESAARLSDAGQDEQARLVEDLAMQIRTEQDPLVRLAIQEAVGNFQVPLARDMVVAGISDDDLDVRLACCRILGERGEMENVPILSNVLRGSDALDVKLAATDALGNINSTESVPTLALALKSRDPAMQYAAVEALKRVSDEDLGNDVSAWLAFAEQARQSTSAPDVAEPQGEAMADSLGPPAASGNEPTPSFADRILPNSPYYRK